MGWGGVREIPAGAFFGSRAINTQTYVESNVKLGLQFEASLFRQDLPSAGTVAVAIQTGAKKVILKSVEISLSGSGVTLRTYKDPVFSGGNSVNVFNLSEVNPQATTVTMTDDVTVTGVGTEIAAPIYYIGSAVQGAGSRGASRVVGLERVLDANSTYLIQAENRDSQAQDVSNYMTWFEGEPDLPL